jgi:hypothetical protein
LAKLVWNCLAVFELQHWRLMLLLSAASANDFVKAIAVMCMCGLNVVGRQSSEAHVWKGSSLGDVAINSRAGLHVDVQQLSAFFIE